MNAGKTGISKPCRKYESQLEDYFEGAANAELRKHVSSCKACQAALADSRLAGNLLREAWDPADEPRGAFLAGVLSKIREEQIRAESPAAFWNPLEFLASRLALTAAMLLLGLSVYMAEFAPRRAPVLPSSQTELNAADFPQPPGDPDSNDEVLQSLAERHYGQ
jgi:hypothetical protein